MDDRLKDTFLNYVRSLYNIDGYCLPELTPDQRQRFVREPVRYFIGADKFQSDAIWSEVLKRQKVELSSGIDIKHIHVRVPDPESTVCLKCGRDLRDDIHLRVS